MGLCLAINTDEVLPEENCDRGSLTGRLINIDSESKRIAVSSILSVDGKILSQ